jgi:hypothetical protein
MTPSHTIDRTDAASACRDLARAAAALARVPCAAVRFERGRLGSVDATYGLDNRGDMAAAEAFARIALLHVDPLVIHDAAAEPGLPPEFAPARTHLRWFGSLPVQARDGSVVGVICVFDRDPQPEERARLDEVANLVHGLDVVGAVLGRGGRKRKEARAVSQGRESLEAELLAEIGILRARLEVLGRAAQRRDPDLDERAARAWLAVELEALRDVADRTNTLAIRIVRVSGEDAAAA